MAKKKAKAKKLPKRKARANPYTVRIALLEKAVAALTAASKG